MMLTCIILAYMTMISRRQLLQAFFLSRRDAEMAHSTSESSSRPEALALYSCDVFFHFAGYETIVCIFTSSYISTGKGRGEVPLREYREKSVWGHWIG